MSIIESRRRRGGVGFTNEEQLCIINKQLFAVSAFILIDILEVVTLRSSRFLLCLKNNISNDNEETKVVEPSEEIVSELSDEATIEDTENSDSTDTENSEYKCENELINKITNRNSYFTKFSITTALIISFYYFFQAIDDFEADKSRSNFNFVITNFLYLINKIISFITIFFIDKNDISEEEEIEEEIGEVIS